MADHGGQQISTTGQFGDISESGTWDATTEVSLWDELDDSSPDGTSTDVESDAVNGNTSQEKSFEVWLQSPAFGSGNTQEIGWDHRDLLGHRLEFTARKGNDTAGDADVKMRYSLYDEEGGLIRSVLSGVMTDAYQEFGVNLRAEEALRMTFLNVGWVKVEAVGIGTGTARELWVSSIRYEMPARHSDSADRPDFGDDSCDGTDNDGVGPANEEVVTSGQTLATEMTTETSATEFCIQAGTYSAPDAGLPVQTGDVLNGDGEAYTDAFGWAHGDKITERPDAIIEAVNDAQHVIDGDDMNADDVVLKDLTLKGGEDETGSLDPHAFGDCTQDANDSTDAGQVIEEGQAKFCGTGVEPGDDWLILRSRVTEAETRGIASAGSNLVVVQSEIDHVGVHSDNNIKSGGCSATELTAGSTSTGYDDYENPNDGVGDTSCPDNNGVAGAIKTGAANGAYVIYQSYVHENDQGIWCDTDCDDSNDHGAFLVYSNVVEDNAAFGIKAENSYHTGTTGDSRAFIYMNESVGNGWNQYPGSKADIGVISWAQATVENNTMGQSTQFSGTTGDLGRAFAGEDPNGRGDSEGFYSTVSNDPDGEVEDCESPFVCAASP